MADPSVGGVVSTTRQIVDESGWGKLYDGLPSILFRQISFGMMKFLVFDYFTGACIYCLSLSIYLCVNITRPFRVPVAIVIFGTYTNGPRQAVEGNV